MIHYQLLIFKDYAILLLFYQIKDRFHRNEYMEVQLGIRGRKSELPFCSTLVNPEQVQLTALF